MLPQSYVLKHPPAGLQVAEFLVQLKDFWGSGGKLLKTIEENVSGWINYLLRITILIFAIPVLVTFLVFLLLFFFRRVKLSTNEIALEVKQLKNELIKLKSGNIKQDEVLNGAFSDAQEYLKFKHEQEKFLKLEESMGIFEKITIEEQPRWARLILRPLRNFYLAFKELNQEVQKIVDEFDRVDHRSGKLRQVSEQELWKNRIKAYEYVI